MAFLDIMPLTRGHVLVTPRRHYEMLGDVSVQIGQEVRTLSHRCSSSDNRAALRGVESRMFVWLVSH